MALSNKHYVEIARILNTAKAVKSENQFDFGVNYAVNEVKMQLTYLFEVDNPNFDRQRFIDACEGR